MESIKKFLTFDISRPCSQDLSEVILQSLLESAKPQSIGSISALSTYYTSASLTNNLERNIPNMKVRVKPS